MFCAASKRTFSKCNRKCIHMGRRTGDEKIFFVGLNEMCYKSHKHQDLVKGKHLDNDVRIGINFTDFGHPTKVT